MRPSQTLVKTGTGIWEVTYNALNRPTCFTRTNADDSVTTVTAAYDYMGRRVFKKVEENGATTLHQRYIYRGYLQIAALDLTRSTLNALWFIIWDPTEPVATRPLAIQKDDTWYTYGLDLTKSVMEVYSSSGFIATAYTYTPFGEVTDSGNVTQPIQWSSEYYDIESSLVYYNYRNYNYIDDRWLTKDSIHETNCANLYLYNSNSPVNKWDILGKLTMIIHGTILWIHRHILGEEIWYSGNEVFARKLNEATHDVWKITSAKAQAPNFHFHWFGGNWHASRIKGAQCLAALIKEVRCVAPKEKINLVAHSHGGNVVMSALDLLSRESNKKKYMVDYVVLLGTPHVSIQHNGVRRALYFTNEGRSMIKEQIYSISSSGDGIQAYWADVKEGISIKYLPKDYEADFFDYVKVEQYFGQDNVTVTHYTPGVDEDWLIHDSSMGHSKLHNETMANVVGELLQGTRPSDIKNIKLTRPKNSKS